MSVLFKYKFIIYICILFYIKIWKYKKRIKPTDIYYKYECF